MKLFWNKATRVLGTSATSSTNVQNIRVKRFEDVAIELVPVNAAGEIELFEAGATGLLVVKKLNDFTGAAVLLDSAWTVPTTADAGYVFDILAAGTSLDTELGTSPEKAFAAEIFIELPGQKRRPLPSFALIVENNYWREDEPPDDPENPYPAPANLITLGNARGTVRITAGGLELRDTVTNVWRRLEFRNGELSFITEP